jgi:hypothetical protein
MCAQPPPQIDRLSDVERPPLLVADDIHACAGRRGAANPFAGPAPRLVPILNDQRLGHQPAGQLFGGPPNPQHFGGETSMVRPVAHLA